MNPWLVVAWGVSVSIFVIACGIAVGLYRRLSYQEVVEEEEEVEKEAVAPPNVEAQLMDRLNAELSRSWAVRPSRRE
jgi:hypothetical protein